MEFLPPKETGEAVRATRVTKYFDEVVALDGVDLSVAQGRVHGIVGPNGAGKTTLLSLLLGLAAASEGELEVLGCRTTRVLGVPRGVNGFVDAPGLYPALTARENLAQLARLYRLDDAQHRVHEVLELVGLDEVAAERVRGFSLGMRQRLGLGAALLTSPRLLVMDEPSNGLDPAGRLQVQRVLADFAASGGAVVLSSHRMDDLSQLCDEVTLLARGRVVFDGTVQELADHSPALAHRVVTDDVVRAARLADEVPGVERPQGQRTGRDEVVVLGDAPALDEYLRRLVGSGVRLREFAPVVPVLEAAFLSLTGDESLLTRSDEHETEMVA